MSEMPTAVANKQTPFVRVYLGGSFNPVHYGHLHMIQTVGQKLSAMGILHTLYLMPSHSPFKTDLSVLDADERLRLLTLATCKLNIAIEPYELYSGIYPSYTIDTLSVLRNSHPQDVLIFVMGQDSFQSLAHWRSGFDILNLCHLWVFERGNFLPIQESACLSHLFAVKAGLIYFDDSAIVQLSSTDIRKTLADLFAQEAPLSLFQKTLKNALPNQVIDHIYHNKLYHP